MGCVYLVCNQMNGKRYVGKTIASLANRRSVHLAAAKKPSRQPFSRALAKYGSSAFCWTVLFESDSDRELLRVECVMIAMFHTKSPRGYNLTNGGEGMAGYRRPPEVSAKISAKLKGRPLSEEHKRKIGLGGIGRKASLKTKARLKEAWCKRKPFGPEFGEKMSRVLQGRTLTEEHRIKIGKSLVGHRHTALSRKKMSLSQKGRVVSLKTRKILSIACSGWRHTPEAIERISQASKQRHARERGEVVV